MRDISACAARLAGLALTLAVLSGPAPARAAAAAAPPEAVRFRNYGVADGLSYDRVRAIAQDGAGYIWIATRDGLNRYDGRHFRVYRHDPADPRSLPDNVVLDLATTDDGELWIGTAGGGLAHYDAQRDDFTRYQAGDGSGLASNYVRGVQAGPDGQLWLGVFGATVQRFDPRSGTARDLPLGRPSVLDAVHNVFFLPRGDRVFAGRDLVYWDGRSGTLRSLTATLAPDLDPQIEGAIVDRHETVWAPLDDGGLLRLGLDGKVIARYRSGPDAPLTIGAVRAVGETRGGEIWLGMQNGIARYEPNGDRFIENRHDDADPSSPVAEPRVLFESREGVIWAGSLLHGLSVHDPLSQAVSVYRHSPEDERSLPTSVVQAVLSLPDGDHWLGLGPGGGLVLFRPGVGVLRQYRHNPADPGSLASDSITALALGRDGSLWVGTDNEGVDRLAPGAIQFQHYRQGSTEPLAPPVNLINALHVDAQDTLWVATDGGGLVSLCQGCERFTSYRLAAEDPFDLQRSTATGIAQAPDRSLWVGLFGGGVLRLDPSSGSARRFPAARDGKGPRNAVVRALLAGRDGSLWAGSSDGVDRILREPGGAVSFQPQPLAAGDTARGVTCLTEDDQGQIWAGTTDGLLRMDPRGGGELRRVRLLNDLDQRGYSSGACQSMRGRLYLGSSIGLVAFAPGALPPPAPLGPLVLEELLLAHGPVRPAPGQPDALLQRTLRHTASVQLGHAQAGLFGFQFAALDYRSGERIAYRYRLDGLHADWLPVPAGQNTVMFPGVPAATYRFRVQALREGSEPREAGIDLRIAPPPWRTTWAYGSYLLLGLALVMLYSHYRRRLRTARGMVVAAQHSEQDLRLRNTELESRIAERGAELNRSSNERQYAQDLLKQVQDQLREAQQLAALGGLAASIAQEANAPLQAGLAAAESLQQQTALLMQRLAQRELRRSELNYFQQIAGEGANLIVHNLHSTERLLRVLQQAAADQLRDTARRLDLEQCISDALLLLGPMLRATPHRVQMECPHPVVIHSPPGALHQIISGLVRNALEHAFPDGTPGTVRIRIEADGGVVRLLVSDDGCGMDEAQRAQIFAPSFALRSGGGAATLHTVHSLVSQVLQGSIECTSQPGRGTCFEIRWVARTR